MGVRVVIGIPWGRGDLLSFILSPGRRGLGLDGGEMGIATGEEDLAGDFSDVAIDGEPTSLAGEPKGDFGNSELGQLGKVSVTP